MAGTVIVALPAVDDAVHKYSSEKIPHLTLLYLGDDVSDTVVSHIREYVAHAAGVSLAPFHLQVDFRGELGEDKADVLFFDTKDWWIEKVNEFRSNLLKNTAIKTAYDKAAKFNDLSSETWKPHLTMGYPNSPAKEDDREYPGFHHVRFDRVAVWSGDFVGPEFRLEENDQLMDVMHADMGEDFLAHYFASGMTWEAFIAHYGKLGMKWGVRNDKPSGGGDSGAAPKERGKIRRGATKANVALNAGAKVIEQGEKKLIFLPEKNRQNAASATQGQVLATARTINRDPQFKGKDIKNNPELKAAYFSKVEAEAKKIYADELGIARTDAWGEFFGVKVDTMGMRVTAASNRIKHANDDDQVTLLHLLWELDNLGQIKDVKLSDEKLDHDGMDIGLVLMHYGVKGMRWGVITEKDGTKSIAHPAKNDPAAKPTKSQVQVAGKPGKFAKTQGGKNLPISNDALAALEGRQKAKASTTDALSNDELKKVVERMRLEQQYGELAYTSDRRGKGERFVAGLFGQKRYGKGKRQFTDSNEEAGEKTREAIENYRKMKAQVADTTS